ncbi:hypothetical protein JCM10212_000478 [Sporobolomyces blumeae]
MLRRADSKSRRDASRETLSPKNIQRALCLRPIDTAGAFCPQVPVWPGLGANTPRRSSEASKLSLALPHFAAHLLAPNVAHPTRQVTSVKVLLGDNAQQLVVESHRSNQTRSLLPYNTTAVRTVIRESHSLADSITTTAAPFVGTQGAQPTQGVSAELIISALALNRNKRALYIYHQQRVDTVKDKFWEKGGVASNVFAQGMETRQNMTTFDEAFAKGYSDLCLQFKTSWYGGHRERDADMDDDGDEDDEEEAIQLMDAVDLFGGGTDISPPKDLMVDVRVVKDLGEVELLSGNRINLEKGKQYFLPREDVEAMVVSGAVEVVE